MSGFSFESSGTEIHRPAISYQQIATGHQKLSDRVAATLISFSVIGSAAEVQRLAQYASMRTNCEHAQQRNAHEKMARKNTKWKNFTRKMIYSFC